MLGKGFLLLVVLALATCGSPPPPATGHIAFMSPRDGNLEIYVMNADGSNPVNLTHNRSSDSGPAWSPDGKRIAFTSVRGGNYEIYVMNADGADQTNLTDNRAIDDEPAWSPDGKCIAFQSNRYSRGENWDEYPWEICIMNADGSGQTRLTRDPAGDVSPAWSP